MSSINVNAKIEGDDKRLLDKLKYLSDIRKKPILSSMAEGLRTSTIERFQRERDPEGKKWKQSIRAKEKGGVTLTDTTGLRASIRTSVGKDALAVGTNSIRAATHQFGDTRTIRAKKSKYLRFQIGGKNVLVKSVTVHIPARPFLGVSQEDMQEIKDTLESAFED